MVNVNVPTNVQPGEIISSSLFNLILNQLSLHEQRITGLEQGGPSGGGVVDILSTDPVVQIAAGQVLTLHGVNFAFPPTDNTVTVDGTIANAFQPDSTGSTLKFTVPASLNIPSGGKNVVIQVTNSKGSTQIVYRVLPLIPVTGPTATISDISTLTGTKPLHLGQPCRITGTNFAPNVSDNVVTFQIVTAANQTIIYPKPGQPPLPIDLASTTTQLTVTVPLITEIAGGSSQEATVRVQVGAQTAPAFNVPIINLNV